MDSLPDVLVLGAGGTLGEAWLSGLLSGIEDATGLEFGGCEAFLGTSAGAIVASRLASGRGPRRPTRAAVRAAASADDDAVRRPAAPSDAALLAALRSGHAALAAGRPVLPLALRAAAPAGALARALLLRRIPEGTLSDAALRGSIRRWRTSFDGRLRIVAVDRADGRRVVFGSPGAPDATVADAVAASCAIPGRFAPVSIGGRDYVDGGVWSVTNLDAAPAGLGTRVLCLNPIAGPEAGPAGAAACAFARARAAIEEQALRARGAEVTMLVPDRRSATAIGRDPMDRGPLELVLANGYRQGFSWRSH